MEWQTLCILQESIVVLAPTARSYRLGEKKHWTGFSAGAAFDGFSAMVVGKRGRPWSRASWGWVQCTPFPVEPLLVLVKVAFVFFSHSFCQIFVADRQNEVDNLKKRNHCHKPDLASRVGARRAIASGTMPRRGHTCCATVPVRTAIAVDELWI